VDKQIDPNDKRIRAQNQFTGDHGQFTGVSRPIHGWFWALKLS